MGEQQFKHESYQDRGAVVNLLREILRGLERGTLRFADNNGEIVVNPEELMQLEIKVKKKEGKARIAFKLEWKDDAAEQQVEKDAFLKIEAVGQEETTGQEEAAGQDETAGQEEVGADRESMPE